MSLATTVRAMELAGCTAKQIADVVVAHHEAEEARRSEKRAKDAERQRKSRASRNVTVTRCDIDGHSVTEATPYTEDAPTHAEPEPNKTTSPPPTSFAVAHDVAPRPVAKPKSTNAECVKALAAVLDAEHAAAVVEHRNRIRKPMTGHAAALLAKSLSQAPNPNAAADEMIERGWQFWKPDWGRGQGPPGRVRENSLLAGIEEIEERRFGTSNVQHFPRIAG